VRREDLAWSAELRERVPFLRDLAGEVLRRAIAP